MQISSKNVYNIDTKQCFYGKNGLKGAESQSLTLTLTENEN